MLTNAQVIKDNKDKILQTLDKYCLKNPKILNSSLFGTFKPIVIEVDPITDPEIKGNVLCATYELIDTVDRRVVIMNSLSSFYGNYSTCNREPLVSL